MFVMVMAVVNAANINEQNVSIFHWFLSFSLKMLDQ